MVSWVTIELYLFFGVAAGLGIIMYYWTKATHELNRWQFAQICAKLGIDDIES